MNIQSAPLDMRVAWYRKKLAELVQDAAAQGVMLTAEVVSLQPFATGNYFIRTSARAARDAED